MKHKTTFFQIVRYIDKRVYKMLKSPFEPIILFVKLNIKYR